MNEIVYPCSISIREKYWTSPHAPDPIPTGNYEVKVHDSEGDLIDIDHVVPICRLGRALQTFVDDYEIEGFDVDEVWNSSIEFHNKHNELFIYAFSKKHKRYLHSLFPFYNDERLPKGKHQPVVLWKGSKNGYRKILVRETEKALLLNLPEIGAQWIPKSMIYKVGDDFYCARKKTANTWNFGALDVI